MGGLVGLPSDPSEAMLERKGCSEPILLGRGRSGIRDGITTTPSVSAHGPLRLDASTPASPTPVAATEAMGPTLGSLPRRTGRYTPTSAGRVSSGSPKLAVVLAVFGIRLDASESLCCRADMDVLRRRKRNGRPGLAEDSAAFEFADVSGTGVLSRRNESGAMVRGCRLWRWLMK